MFAILTQAISTIQEHALPPVGVYSKIAILLLVRALALGLMHLAMMEVAILIVPPIITKITLIALVLISVF